MPKESASAPIFLDQTPTVRIHPEISDSEMTAQRERDLVLRAIDGCAESFGTWFEYHRAGLYRKAYAMTGSRDVAEDIVSDVSERTLKAMPRFRLTDAPPRSFLYRVTHNQSVSHLRGKKEVVELHPEVKDENKSDFENSLVNNLDVDSQRARIIDALSKLNEAQAKVIQMRFFEGLDYDEVAREMGRTPAAIRVIQFRALAALREKSGHLKQTLTIQDSCDVEGVA